MESLELLSFDGATWQAVASPLQVGVEQPGGLEYTRVSALTKETSGVLHVNLNTAFTCQTSGMLHLNLQGSRTFEDLEHDPASGSSLGRCVLLDDEGTVTQVECRTVSGQAPIDPTYTGTKKIASVVRFEGANVTSGKRYILTGLLRARTIDLTPPNPVSNVRVSVNREAVNTDLQRFKVELSFENSDSDDVVRYTGTVTMTGNAGSTEVDAEFTDEGSKEVDHVSGSNSNSQSVDVYWQSVVSGGSVTESGYGEVKIKIFAVDAAGNRSKASSDVTVPAVSDSHPPSALTNLGYVWTNQNSIQPASGATLNVTLTWDESAAVDLLHYELDGVTVIPTSDGTGGLLHDVVLTEYGDTPFSLTAVDAMSNKYDPQTLTVSLADPFVIGEVEVNRDVTNVQATFTFNEPAYSETSDYSLPFRYTVTAIKPDNTLFSRDVTYNATTGSVTATFPAQAVYTNVTIVSHIENSSGTQREYSVAEEFVLEPKSAKWKVRFTRYISDEAGHTTNLNEISLFADGTSESGEPVRPEFVRARDNTAPSWWEHKESYNANALTMPSSVAIIELNNPMDKADFNLMTLVNGTNHSGNSGESSRIRYYNPDTGDTGAPETHEDGNSPNAASYVEIFYEFANEITPRYFVFGTNNGISYGAKRDGYKTYPYPRFVTVSYSMDDGNTYSDLAEFQFLLNHHRSLGDPNFQFTNDYCMVGYDIKEDQVFHNAYPITYDEYEF